jgi:hypothetical protein
VSDINYVYILSEDDNDELFYKECLEKITGKPYEILGPKLRRTGGISEVRRLIPLFINTVQRSGLTENVVFLIALDNDRSPIHPEHATPADWSKLPKADQKNSCRYCEVETALLAKLGLDRQQWPIRGGIIVPVQMLESWLLLILNPGKYINEQSLPSFAKRDSSSAKYYYKSKPPQQLKDLREIEKERLGIGSNRHLCEYCAEQLDPVDLSQRSPSFKQFMDEIMAWGQP